MRYLLYRVGGVVACALFAVHPTSVPPRCVCRLELLQNSYESRLWNLTGWIGTRWNPSRERRRGSDRDHPFRPPKLPGSSEAKCRPARSLFCSSPSSAMSGPTQYASKKEVGTSYRPKSYVSLLPGPIPNVWISILFSTVRLHRII